MKRAAVALAALGAAAGLIAAVAPAPPVPVPADNPTSAARVELGRRLFYDADLSIDGTLACASCHEQRRAFAEGVATHGGVKGALGRRNAPGLANVAYLSPLTWADPTATTLETQAVTPLTGEHPVEMGMAGQEAELARRLAADACYRSMFAAAYPGEPVGLATTTKALAAFERTLVSFGSPYDRRAMDAAARRGEAVFKARGCADCHAGDQFTDSRFHVVGTANPGDDGAFEKTGDSAHRGAFRTAPLRNVAVSDPYLHDGSAATIAQAVARHATVSADDMAAIEAFLAALTDRAFIANEALSIPKAFCGVKR